MVEKVGEDGGELHAETFGDSGILLDAEIYVPERHASKNSSTSTIRRVNAQDRVPKTGVRLVRILKHAGAEEV